MGRAEHRLRSRRSVAERAEHHGLATDRTGLAGVVDPGNEPCSESDSRGSRSRQCRATSTSTSTSISTSIHNATATHVTRPDQSRARTRGSRELSPDASARRQPRDREVEQPFVAALTIIASDREVLDRLDDPDAIAHVRSVIADTMMAEAPVHAARLAKIVMTQFGFERATPKRTDQIIDLATDAMLRRGSTGIFLWSNGVDVDSWRHYRRAVRRHRPDPRSAQVDAGRVRTPGTGTDRSRRRWPIAPRRRSPLCQSRLSGANAVARPATVQRSFCSTLSPIAHVSTRVTLPPWTKKVSPENAQSAVAR